MTTTTPSPAPVTTDTIEDAIQDASYDDRNAIRERFNVDVLDLDGKEVTGTLGVNLVTALIFIHRRRTAHVGTDEAYEYATQLPMRQVMGYFSDDTGPVLDERLRDVSPSGEGDGGASVTPPSEPSGASTPDSPGTSTAV